MLWRSDVESGLDPDDRTGFSTSRSRFRLFENGLSFWPCWHLVSTEEPNTVIGSDSSTATSRMERLGTWLPTLCAVHCLLTPALLGLAPALALPPAAELPVLAVSVALALLAVHSGVQDHGDRRVLGLLMTGSLLWLASLQGLLAPLPEYMASPVGGLLVATSLVWNGRLRHRSLCRATCTCPVPHGTERPQVAELDALGE
ncbi:MAG: MerC domain-containing protein [Gemmatimonadota bacterium]